MKAKLDLRGMSKKEIKDLVLKEGYSTSTYYKALKRKTLIVNKK